MNAQQMLELYLSKPGGNDSKELEQLSIAIRELVRKAIVKKEVSDIEDFEEECVLAIWTRISLMKSGENFSSIDNLEAFIRRAVHNRYCDAIRRKRPEWYNLKLELLDIFSGKTNIFGFAIWYNPNNPNERLCGFAEWKDRTDKFNLKLRRLLDNQNDFKLKFLGNKNPQELPTYELADKILNYCNGPLDIESLTGAIIELRQTKTVEVLSIDSQPDGDEESGSPVDWLVSKDVEVEKQVVDTAWFDYVMTWFWTEFKELSLKQKKAIIYGMNTEQVMALCTSIGFTNISKELEITPKEFLEIVNDLPKPDSETALELGIQPRAVPSVRFKAWGRIRKRTQKSNLPDLES